jgi:DNA-binding CsgD family transcriptional regulator
VEAHQGDYAAARVLYEEGLAIAKKSGDKLHIALILEGMASVLATQGEPVRAARLWGAAEVLRETIGAPIWPVDRATYQRSLATACALLGKKVFAAAWAEGRTITLEQALATREPVTPLISTLAEPSSTPPARPVTTYPDGLTAREVEVLRLVAQGFTDAQVAEQLVISPRTVNWHLTTIYSKIGVSSRSAATRYAIEQKLV